MTIKANTDASFDGRQTTDTEYYGSHDVTPEEANSWSAEEPEFHLTAEYYNAALQAAGVEGLSVTDEPEGLRLDSADLEYREIVDRLLNGLVALHVSVGER